MNAAVLTLIASGFAAAAGGTFGLALARVITAPRGDRLLPTEAERQRRRTIRDYSTIYRWFEPVVDRLARFLGTARPEQATRLHAHLELAEPVRWTAAEFLAVEQLKGLVAAVPGAALGWVLFDLPGAVIVAIGLVYLIPELIARSVEHRANRYRAEVAARLPFVLDLMGLVLQSGGGFRDALASAISENEGHPIGTELARVWTGVEQGSSQPDALWDMARRLNDPDVNEVVQAINTAGERGTPLRDSLEDLSKQMTVRTFQRMEKASEEAKVHITWPAMLVMIACLLIVAAPLLLSGVTAGGR